MGRTVHRDQEDDHQGPSAFAARGLFVQRCRGDDEQGGLTEQELRQAMERSQIETLPLYPEDRQCRRPTARKTLDLLAGVQRHELTLAGQPPEVLLTELTPLQKQILKLVGISPKSYGL